ncbi:MAG: DNA recombination protein RmuC [Arenicellales bacterium]|nr:DNA recombination protein RmuC [Arenicellales bacterium]MDP7119152.1 DNA recombination protein RmuC [Arenicellales bacterium]MDP7193802.1 DNA recombination protein RmuC [Arenicellales bacterium]MDP7563768.1 DNA recombination protein RmuC [Arenicellales bacterium]
MTTEVLLVVLALLVVVNLALLVRLLIRQRSAGADQAVREELRAGREEAAGRSRELREEVSGSLGKTAELLTTTVGQLGTTQKEQLESVTKQVRTLVESNQQRMDGLRATISEQLNEMREANEKKLEEMRRTVDEKLQGTLEKRLGESFKLVSERLDAVHKGLGEMQTLATGVGDLKNVLTNVKVRGTWAEYQLEAILEQVLTPEQFDRNVATREGSAERVEFAIRLPGRGDDPDDCVWLPIDSKFPQEDYLRLAEAAREGDADSVAQSTKELLRSVTQSAKTISDKYLNPPQTTDFAVLYLPTEGLYAEVLRQPGLISQLQQDHRVVVSGPTTIAALLSSLRLGFRTLAIEKQASEVWQVLAAVKTEFGKFGGVLDKVKKQLATASNTIDETQTRTRVMARKLREVEQLPVGESDELLELLPEDELESD